MKRIGAGFLVSLLSLVSLAQNSKDNTLLWKISGKGLDKPSYLFGTIHMLCKEDAFLGTRLSEAIRQADQVYLELDMDNLFEMIGALQQMKMKNDTTLADLLTPEEYEKAKTFFEKKSSLLPFSVLETYKPLLASSLLMESSLACDAPVAMEQLIMEEAKKNSKKIEGLETMAYQMSIFDSIPYKTQAGELLKFISEEGKQSDGDKEFELMMDAYRKQDLEKLGELLRASDAGILQYEDMLLNNRNHNWVKKLKTVMPGKSLVIAVGAGHLPGEQGLIRLLRKEGYTVTPIENKNNKLREI